MILATILVGSLSLTAQTLWKIDPSHSKVLFTVSHMVVSEVTGKFNDFDAMLVQTGSDFEGSTLTASIKTKSIDTENEKRDAHLRSSDFFNAEKYPEITFVGKSFKKIEGGKYKITGDFTMHGITKTVTLDAKFNGTMKGPWGNTVAGFKATTSVNRNDYGVQWNKALESAGNWLVGENVDITLQIELVKQDNG